MKNTFTSIIFTLFFANGALAAGHSLSSDARITEELTAAAIGEEIRNHCSTISARRLFVLSKAMELKRYALDHGHSDAQINAFLKSNQERARIFAKRDQYFAEHDIVKGNAESYCALGRSEIANESFLGSLMYSH